MREIPTSWPPPSISPGTARVDGRESRFQMNSGLLQATEGWLGRRTWGPKKPSSRPTIVPIDLHEIHGMPTQPLLLLTTEPPPLLPCASTVMCCPTRLVSLNRMIGGSLIDYEHIGNAILPSS
ncbi:hypothetical protein HD806DRAFT_258093 [Xylariaceae sp. AK1471]|nr:hypothetical protein HD806DRAFT_258093 [Xylariaceae sp. AK1471]